jgi:hypothetical protein
VLCCLCEILVFGCVVRRDREGNGLSASLDQGVVDGLVDGLGDLGLAEGAIIMPPAQMVARGSARILSMSLWRATV